MIPVGQAETPLGRNDLRRRTQKLITYLPKTLSHTILFGGFRRQWSGDLCQNAWIWTGWNGI